MITNKIIKDLYTKHENHINGGARDSWDVAADIINELITRKEYPSDASYYFHIREVWNMIQEYINSTHTGVLFE